MKDLKLVFPTTTQDDNLWYRYYTESDLSDSELGIDPDCGFGVDETCTYDLDQMHTSGKEILALI